MIELTIQLEIGGVSVVDNFITLHHSIAFEMSNASMRMQGEFWLLAQAFMLEMAKYHDPELGPNKNNRVALECAVIKKLMDDAFGQEA